MDDYDRAVLRDQYEATQTFLQRHETREKLDAFDFAVRGGCITSRCWDVLLLTDESGGSVMAGPLTYDDARTLAQSLNSVALDPNELYAIVFDPEYNDWSDDDEAGGSLAPGCTF